MLCQKCKKNEATVYIKQAVNGAVTEMHLCPQCAEKEKISSYFTLSPDNLFSGFFSDSVLGGGYIGDQKSCPVCHATMSDLAATGRPGCAKCYDIFGDELSKIIYGIHGNARHTGAVPGKHAEQIAKKKEIAELKKQQKIAVEEQNYEKAAELRDRIKALENGGDN